MQELNKNYSFTLNNPKTLTRLRTPILILQFLLIALAYNLQQITYQQFSLSLLVLIPSFVFNHFFSQLQTTPRHNIIPLGLDLLTLFFLIFINGGIENPFYLILLIHIFLGPFYLSKEMAFLFTLLTLSSLFILPFSPYPFEPMDLKLFTTIEFPFIAFIIAGLLFWLFSTWLVTEIKKLNNFVQNSIKLQHRTDRYRSLGLLTAGICHELGTPLHTLEMRINQLKKKLEFFPEVSQSASKDLEVLLRNTNKCALSIKKLNLQTHSDQIDLSESFCSPLLALEKTVDAYTKNQEDTLVINFKDENLIDHKPAQINLSEVLYTRCLLELFENAQEAGANQIDIDYKITDTQVILELCDNGPGFSREILNHLGQPFVSSKNRGSGLGLYHLKNTIDYIGGKFEILPSNKGARIKIHLPLQERLKGVNHV